MIDSANTPSPWVLPDEPPSIRLMNTIWADRFGVHDSLRTLDDLDAWRRAVQPTRVGAASTKAELATATELRDALRRIAAILLGDTRPGAAPTMDASTAVHTINAALAESPPVRLALAGEGVGVAERDSSSMGAWLAALAAEFVDLAFGGDEPRLAACGAPGCVLYYFRDHARRGWCSVTCGNRARAARHYRRHRESES